LATGVESKLAAMTGGVSIPAVSLGKQWMGKLNKEGFAREAVNPYGGLTQDLNNPQKPVKIDLSGMANKE
jgi:transposase